MNNLHNNRRFGAVGEIIAEMYMKKNGYKIIQRNYETSTGEIDLIAKKNDMLVFIEVKTRTNQQYGLPEESINIARANRIRKVALCFISDPKGNRNSDIRFDIISILADRKKLEGIIKTNDDDSKIANKSDLYCTIDHIIDAF